MSVYGLAFDPQDVDRHLLFAEGVLPHDVITIVTSYLQMLAANPPATLGGKLAVGMAVALWSAQSAASSMITALNAVYERRETRGFLKLQLAGVVMAFWAILVGLIFTLLAAAAPLALHFMTLETSTARWSFFSAGRYSSD